MNTFLYSFLVPLVVGTITGVVVQCLIIADWEWKSFREEIKYVCVSLWKSLRKKLKCTKKGERE